MKALSKQKRDQLILTAMLTVAVSVGLWYGLINPQNDKLKKIALKIQDQEAKVTNADKLIKSAPEFQSQFESTQEKLRSIEQGMASGDMYSWIFLTMNKFKANHAGVEIPQFSREVATDAGILPKFPYKAALFNVRGTAYYHDLGKFLADFENTFPYLRVQNLELEPGTSSPAGGTADSEKLAFKMEIVALVNPNTR